ncbi:sensor histidine kinase [Psychrobacillus antarcticus]|uniref:sensor histidine kinase n=1 Tax=Psychrobacillus antarcticus TaxID=2879115 RepID=UPI00387EB22C
MQIIFKNSGIGINSEQLTQIFVRFYRVHTARMKDGTGLGLSIVNKVVELYGGEVNVTSKVGKGSTFEIKLPIRRS